MFLNFFAKYFFEIFIIQKHSALLHAHISKSRKIILKFFFVLFRPPTQITFFVSTNDKHFFFTFAISTNLLFLFHFYDVIYGIDNDDDVINGIIADDDVINGIVGKWILVFAIPADLERFVAHPRKKNVFKFFRLVHNNVAHSGKKMLLNFLDCSITRRFHMGIRWHL